MAAYDKSDLERRIDAAERFLRSEVDAQPKRRKPPFDPADALDVPKNMFSWASEDRTRETLM